MTKTPQELGYRMPAEWEPHAATWLAWPHNAETWPGKLDKMPALWARFAKELAPHETVHICVRDAAMEQKAKAACPHNIQFHHIPTNDSWIRDFGPIFVKNDSQIAMTDWIFNTWGGKWEPRPLDNAVPKIISEKFGTRRFETKLVLEGGSIDPNGQGLMLTTESCLLSPTRNPHLSRKEIEKALFDYLGVSQVVWLKSGIAGDDTSGHIDDIARFVNTHTVVCIEEKDPRNKNYQVLQDNLKILRQTRDAQGRLLDVISLPMPRPIPGPKGEGYEDDCIPASYANFYIANQVVLLPVFEQDTDAIAFDILKRCFPTRTIIPIPCQDLVWGLGGIHCITQQEPL